MTHGNEQPSRRSFSEDELLQKKLNQLNPISVVSIAEQLNPIQLAKCE